MANVLKANGIEKGDRVCIYLPMIPELAISVLACARIGAIHSVVFAGFSATALASRIQDCTSKLIVTADGGFRGNKEIGLKIIVDEALLSCPSITKCLVVKRSHSTINMLSGRDKYLEDELQKFRMFVKQKLWMQKSLCLFSIHLVPQGNPKECYIAPEVIWFMQATPSKMYLITKKKKFFGVQQTLDGSPGIHTVFTDLY